MTFILCHSDVDLEQEDDATGFLGLRMEQNESCLLEMNQEGLIDHVIEVLGLDVGTVSGKATPAEATLLVRDTNGEVVHGNFSYSSVVGMLFYLSVHSRPDIVYAVNCAACYSSNLKIDCFSDADFASIYGHEKINNPVV